MSTQERLIARAKELNLKQVDIVKATGASKGTVSNWFAGRDIPSSKYIMRLAKKLDTTPDWILYGQNLLSDKFKLSIEDEVHHASIHPDLELGRIDAWDSETPLDEDEVEVPFFMEVELAAGIGGEHNLERRGPKLRFSKSTLRRCGVEAEAAACVKISGNSMEPRLFDGDVVGVNTFDTKIVDGKVYAINHDGLLRVKRLYRLPGNGLRINSINSDEHPDERYFDRDLEQIKVIGRVFWHSSIWD
jgi:phage repressor protein C with HTH and peptisase S24 domain